MVDTKSVQQGRPVTCTCCFKAKASVVIWHSGFNYPVCMSCAGVSNPNVMVVF